MFKRRVLPIAAAFIVVLSLVALAFAEPASASATPIVNAGNVSVTHDDTILRVFPRSTRETVSAGATITVDQENRIVVSASGQATLRLSDGSNVELYQGTVL